MHDFCYINGELSCENVKVSDIVSRNETPFYLYSRKTITDHYRKLDTAFSSIPHLICYSLKANSNTSLIKILAEMGAGADVTSGGELFKALLSGIPPEKIVYAGVGKTHDEIKYALNKGILMFNVESIQELALINEIAGRMKQEARVAIRLNPDVEVETHDYIATGRSENKFGLAIDIADDLFKKTGTFPNVKIEGVHLHIGSQITSVTPFIESIVRVVGFIQKINSELKWLNIGGGLGIIYRDEKPSTAQDFAQAVIPLLKDTGLKIILEPGRFIVGNAGILVTKVLYTKESGSRTFIVVDAGMNDLIRPALYGAYHEIKPLRMGDSREIVADVVGPICETGDCFARERRIPEVKPGDPLAIFSAGAYGFSMASNYNSRPRCSEFLVEGDNLRLIREREAYEDLIKGETLTPNSSILNFTKMCAGGNDFIVIDNRSGLCPDGVSTASWLCKRAHSVGADGLLLLEKGKKPGQLRMRIFNPDGSEAEMCGNGARCIAAFASHKGISNRNVNLETQAGLIQAEVIGGSIEERGKGNSCTVKLKMCEPQGIKLSFKLSVDGKEHTVSFINTGVPHAVLIVENLEIIDIELGRQIRYHKMFQPQGTNVDFVEVVDKERIRLRTYERGVEAETLACGTGAVAAALVGHLLGKVNPPVSVETGGGCTSVVHFKPEKKKVKDVYLQGEATMVYEGTLIEKNSAESKIQSQEKT